jgi:hypothetical protein
MRYAKSWIGGMRPEQQETTGNSMCFGLELEGAYIIMDVQCDHKTASVTSPRTVDYFSLSHTGIVNLSSVPRAETRLKKRKMDGETAAQQGRGRRR